MEFGINLVPTRRTNHRKFMKTGSVVDAERSRRPRSGIRGKHSGLKKIYALSQGKSI